MLPPPVTLSSKCDRFETCGRTTNAPIQLRHAHQRQVIVEPWFSRERTTRSYQPEISKASLNSSSATAPAQSRPHVVGGKGSRHFKVRGRPVIRGVERATRIEFPGRTELNFLERIRAFAGRHRIKNMVRETLPSAFLRRRRIRRRSAGRPACPHNCRQSHRPRARRRAKCPRPAGPEPHPASR